MTHFLSFSGRSVGSLLSGGGLILRAQEADVANHHQKEGTKQEPQGMASHRTQDLIVDSTLFI